MKGTMPEYSTELSELCKKIKTLVYERNFSECALLISEAMRDYPHAPHPHNLMGILLETEGDHAAAIKHFRAAWALDPTYVPSRINLDRYGSFFSTEPYAFGEQDHTAEPDIHEYKICYDEFGNGHAKR